MSHPPSNFQFLEAHDARLVTLGAQAEQALGEDPVLCLVRLRQLGEQLARRASALLGLPLSPQADLRELIDRLAAPPHSVLGADLRDLFHGLRKAGNRAVHELHGTPGEALHQLRMARQLAVWFHRAFGNARDFKPGPFVPPQPAAGTRAELERLRQELASARQQLEETRTRAEQEARRREDAEARSQQEAEERALWQQLAEEAGQKLAQELVLLQAQAAARPAEALRRLAEGARQASERLELDEADTRRLIDAQLREAGWEADTEALTWSKGARPEPGHTRAIAEWPCKGGHVDYVLFAGLQAVALVEAKRWSTEVPGALEQARRYARTLDLRGHGSLPPGGPWGECQVPFLFASNGRPYLKQIETLSGIWFHDVRLPTHLSRALAGWYSPSGLLELLKQNTAAAEQRLRSEPVDLPELGLRDYQVEAIQKIEQALLEGRRTCLVAMATGTGKTRTCVGLVYRLLKAERFRRILFLVDRGALGDQAEAAFKSAYVETAQTFYDVYKLQSLKEAVAEEATRLHIATVQGLVKRVLYAPEGQPPPPVSQYDCIVVDECHRGYTLDRELSESELLFRDEQDYLSKYRRVLEYFDAVKIGLTATPALHTREIFGPPVFEYSYRQAVVEGHLVDHEPPMRVGTELSLGGIHWEAGEEVATLDVETKQLELFNLPDELHFEVEEFNRRVLTENFNRAVARFLAEQIDWRLEGKTLIFCINDKHADLVVKVLKEALAEQYGGVEDGVVVKLTGAVDDWRRKLLHFRNEPQPSIAVTVDLLTTGVDVPAICNLVFLRRVKSRILYEQMLGRATRPYTFRDGSAKSVFHIYDPVGLYEALAPYSAMRPVVVDPSLSFAFLVRELRQLRHEAHQREVLEQILAKVQRKRKRLAERYGEAFEAAAGQGLEAVLERLEHGSPAEAAAWFAAHPRVVEVLDRPTGGGDSLLYISEHPDQVVSVSRGYGKGLERPEDYLEGFRRFVQENLNTIPAMLLVAQRPRELTRQALKELKLTLETAGYSETQLEVAWRELKNEDMAATIIGFIRQQALGEPLVPYEERVQRALKRVLASQAWAPPQRRWLERIGRQLVANEVLDRESFEEGAFKDQGGGWAGVDKVLGGRLEQVLGELVDEVWRSAG
jgi:type I restriction enzyme, R subunit